MLISRAGHYNLYLTDLHLNIFGPPFLIILELVLVFHIYGFRKWSGNFTEMTGLEIYDCTLYIVMTILALILISWTVMVIVTLFTVSVMIFSVMGTVTGLVIMMIPLLTFITVTIVNLTNIEGKTLKTKLRIGF